MESNKSVGIQAENYFIAQLNKLGVPYEFIDTWYDFKVLGNKVEIKSCRISIKHVDKRGERFRIGRFDFTKKRNRERQRKENIWVCFVVRDKTQFMILGLIKARKLEKKRYITLHDLRRIKRTTFEDWVHNLEVK